MAVVLNSLIGILVGKLVDEGIKKIVAILELESDMEALQRNMKNIRRVLVDVESKKIEDKSINHWLAELREVAYDIEDLLDDFAAAKLGKSESVKDTTLCIPWCFRGKNNSRTSKSVKDTTLCIPCWPFRGKNNSSTSESFKDTTLCIPCWPFRGKNNSSTSESVKDTTHCIPELSRDKNNSSTSKSVKDTILSFPGFSQMTEAYMNGKISTRIKNINSNFSKINSEIPTKQLLASLPNADKKVSSLITGTSSFQLDSEIVDIDDDATDLVDRIIRDSNGAHSLFAITGMGGIGKTTLARKVFHHDLIRNHFHDNIVWVCVSSNRSGEDLLKEIVRFFDKKYNESRLSLNELTFKLIEVVKEKRVFIVLDDIWDSRVWEEFLGVPLLKAEKHSRILITTRNKQVAMKMDAAYIHRMTEMNPSDGWSMLWKIVFKGKDNGDMNKLADVGKEIVHKCKCLPLAIKVVGGVLKMTDRTVAAWTRVLSSTTWSMQDLPKDILPSLWLSYEDLPLHLKQCFVYCSLFPEDYKFSQFNLEHLWIAEGFIKKVEGKDVEYSAREYYNELVMRNLLQADIYLLRYKMHDLLRLLAIFVSQNQYIYLQSNNSGLTRRHYLSFIGNDTKVVSQEIKEEDCVRTLLLSDNPQIRMVSSELFSILRRLRVLDLEGTGIKTLPDSLGALVHLRFLNVSYTKIWKLSDSIGALIHLRFLDISRTEIRELPDSIKNLKNLETLEATCSFQLRSLPMGISELFNLRCLRVDRLDNMPIGLDNLKNLRILKDFVVNDWSSSRGLRYTPNLKELKNLSELTDLSIYNLERVASKEEAEEAAIEKKTSLESLTLGCRRPPLMSDEDTKKIEEVFAGIKIPENLTNLKIDGFFGKQLPDHMTSDRLRQVTSLELHYCPSLVRLPSLGDMPKLQRLKIDSAESVVELGSEFLGSLKFPKLQELKLYEMDKLERMFEVEKGAFPCLVKLSIKGCPKLKSLGEGLNHATCLKMLEVTGLDNLKSIENLSSLSELRLQCNERLSSVKNLPSLKVMKTLWSSALKDVNEVGELDYLDIRDSQMKTLPRWLKSITPPKKLSVVGSKKLVLRTQQSVEDQNIIKKCLYAEVRSRDESKYISYRKDPYSYNSNLTGSSGASSSSVTITEHVNDFMGEE